MSRLAFLIALMALPATAAEPVQLGAGAGLLVAPTFLSSAPVFLGGLVSFELELPLGERLGLRVSPMLGAGAAPAGEDPRLPGLGARGSTVGLGALLVDTQLRVRFSSTVSSGLGLLLGLAFGAVAQGASAGFWFGPSLTPLSVRIAAHHELSSWLGLAFLPGTNGVALGAVLPSVRYTFWF